MQKILSPRIWDCVTALAVQVSLKDHSAFICRLRRPVELLDLEDDGSVILWNTGSCSLNSTAWGLRVIRCQQCSRAEDCE